MDNSSAWVEQNASLRPRKSFANFKLALRVLAPSKKDDDYNKFKDSNLKAVEDVFSLFQVDGKVKEEHLRDILAATGSRILQKEIDEYCNDKFGTNRNKEEYLYSLIDFSNLQSKEPYLMKQWKKQRDRILTERRNRVSAVTANNIAERDRALQRAESLSGSEGSEENLADLGVNAYEQFYQAVVLLIDSYGQPTAFRSHGNQIDLTLMEFITSTVGEELNYQEIEHVVKLCGHPSKGVMRPSFFIKKYATLAEELGLAITEEMSEGPLLACAGLEPPIRERRPSQMTHSSATGIVDKIEAHAGEVDDRMLTIAE
jgi:Ca2+-binding EF-hand superfamily protein